MKRSGPQRPRDRTRFVVDAMHGSLARKLRALGFDARYYGSGGDEAMMRLAGKEGRVILSSDRALVASANSRGVPGILLTAKSDGSRLRELSKEAARLGIDLTRGESLCSLCGGELEVLRRADVAGKVPPSVEERHRLFYRCVSCGQVYWRGGHWKKLRLLVRCLKRGKVASVT